MARNAKSKKVAQKIVANKRNSKPAGRIRFLSGAARQFWSPHMLPVEVFKVLKGQGRSILSLWLIGWCAMMLVCGFSLWASYGDVGGVVSQAAADIPSSQTRLLVEVLMMSASLVGGSIHSTLSEAQQLYLWYLSGLLAVSVIWLLRHRLAGDTVSVRDALYNAGAPTIPIVALVALGVLQLVPIAMSVLVVVSLTQSGVVSGALWAALLWLLFVVPSIIVSLYWLSTTLFALIIATNQGTYPREARRLASRAIAGYRASVAVHVVVVLVTAGALLALGTVPFVLFDRIVRSDFTEALTVSVFLGCVVAVLVYSVSYLYLLYRKTIDARA